MAPRARIDAQFSSLDEDNILTRVWVQRARRTVAERHRQWLVMSVAGLTIALTAILLPRLLQLSEIRPVPVAPVWPTPGEPACALPPDTSEHTKPASLAAGPVSLRWCGFAPGSDDGPGDVAPNPLNIYMPPDTLTTGLDEWVNTFNALKPVERNATCPANASTPAMAVLTYGDGSRRHVHGMAAGCGVIGGRMGFATMESLTIQLIRKQRGTNFVPPAIRYARCTPTNSLIEAELTRVVAADVCFRRSPAVTHKHLEPASVPGLVADLTSNLKPAPEAQPEAEVLMLYQPNGERLTLGFSRETGVWVRAVLEPGKDVQYYAWKPNPSSQKALDKARLGGR